VGFDAYYGLEEYPGKEDFDGSWGIYDLPYFNYFAKQQSEMKEPFLTSIFSLSAHHPYRLPANYTDKCEKGSLKIHPMICYSDGALRAYFKAIKNEDWYNRSIFVITADHTAQSTIDAYATSMGIFAIPLIIFEPGSDIAFESNRTTQQADICPSVLDRLGLADESIFFGSSVFDTTSKGFAINYLSGIYQFIDGEFCIQFDGRNVVSVFAYTQDALLERDIKSANTKNMEAAINKLKSIVQQYNESMINNDLVNHE
jgi:phosphoglycerol transferase MdoB-like AlkP superfamily enzyme